VSQELFDEAVRLEEEGQNERALAIWRQLAEMKPTRNAFLRLGSITKKLGRIDDAEHAFRRALEIDARSALALRLLGSLAMHRGAYETAVDYLKRASEIDEDPGIFSILGVALRNTGNAREAEEAYRTAIRMDPNYEEAHYNLGVLLRLSDRPSEAQIHLRKALALDPVFAAAHRELGFVLVLMQRRADAEAEGHLRRAVELAPDDAWAHIYLGAYLGGPDAETEFRIAEKLRPDWSAPLWWLGKIYESRDLDTAQSFFERALQLEPDDWEALGGLARVFKKRGQPDLARKYITLALQQDPSDKKSLAMLRDLDGESGG
jgi:protein O-GlcNAc transferase